MTMAQRIGKRIQLENGEYEPWSFEEDEPLEDDDYYYDDDDNDNDN